MNEIANGLLLSEANVYKQFQRCRSSLKSLPKSYFLQPDSRNPSVDELNYLVDIIYFMFNDGYDTSNLKADNLINKDICFEAVRLAHLLEVVAPSEATKHLLALFYFHMSRFESRFDSSGNFISLRHQDRSKWDQQMVGMGFHFLVKPKRLNRFYLEALIASHHHAASSETTDWKAICLLYDALLEIMDSPILRLNRAISLFEAGRSVEAMQELDNIREDLGENHIYYAMSMASYLEDKFPQKAIFWYQKSLENTRQVLRKGFIEDKLFQLQEKTPYDKEKSSEPF